MKVTKRTVAIEWALDSDNPMIIDLLDKLEMLSLMVHGPEIDAALREAEDMAARMKVDLENAALIEKEFRAYEFSKRKSYQQYLK